MQVIDNDIFYKMMNKATKNVKDEIISKVSDLRDIFGNELAILCPKLLFGYGSWGPS